MGVSHLGVNAVFRLQFLLKAPGQASFVASNQAAANLNPNVLVHKRLFPLGNIHARGGAGPIEFQRGCARTRFVK